MQAFQEAGACPARPVPIGLFGYLPFTFRQFLCDEPCHVGRQAIDERGGEIGMNERPEHQQIVIVAKMRILLGIYRFESHIPIDKFRQEYNRFEF